MLPDTVTTSLTVRLKIRLHLCPPPAWLHQSANEMVLTSVARGRLLTFLARSPEDRAPSIIWAAHTHSPGRERILGAL